MRFFTYALTTGTFVLNFSDGARFLSVSCGASDTCTVTGDLPFKGLSPTSVSIGNNSGISLSSDPTSPLSGITITQVSGTVDIVVGV